MLGPLLTLGARGNNTGRTAAPDTVLRHDILPQAEIVLHIACRQSFHSNFVLVTGQFFRRVIIRRESNYI